ncbi:reverse transcriptase domain-containing protein [Tanacetum coccineum]
MAQDDEEKSAFYTDQGIYCYTKMSFGLKNAGASYQRLVDSDFQSHIERNLEAYVDDMDQHEVESKKCSFWVEEGKFLGYVVTSEGIRANPKKTKAIADMQSPRTLKEMQSLSGKLAVLKRKSISRNKEGHSRATIADHFCKEETLYVYVAAATEAVSAVLLTERKGKQCPIHYVNRTLNEAERNYTPLEKLAMSLLHMSKRLQRYFEAHPIKFITDQPLKKILNKAQAPGKLAKYSVELGAYNITYKPRNTIKVQVLADFLLEAPVGTPHEEFFRLPARVQNKDDVKKETFFTNGASNRLRMARKMKVEDINVKVDSKLVVSQINKSYVASNTSMIKYLAMTRECITEFKSFAIQNIPKNLNQKADILSKLATQTSMAKKQRGKEGPKNENKLVCPRGGRALQERVFSAHVKVYGSFTGQLCHQRNTYGILRNVHQSEVRGGESHKEGYYWPTMHRDARNVT